MHYPKKKFSKGRGESLVFDQIAPMLETVADFVIEELKDVESPDPKVRARAEESVYELGILFMEMMDRLYPTYLRTKWALEHRE